MAASNAAFALNALSSLSRVAVAISSAATDAEMS
jgi:hypothetical protein